jgi:5'(3')-deoxyribonucleotidase
MADKKPFVLGVDLDGVCADFYGGLRPIVAEWLGAEEESLSLTEFRYGLREWGLQDMEHYKRVHRFAVIQREFFRKVEVIDGTGPALRRLSDDGAHIRILTHRLFIPHFHQEAVRQTVEWLDRNGIPYWDICFLKEKVEVGADLYVEDSPDNIEALHDAGKPVIVFTNPTNRHIDAGLRADSWSQVEELVRNFVAEKGLLLEPRKGPANVTKD